MRIVHVSYTDHQEGAARGAVSLHRSLRDVGLDSKMLCVTGSGTAESVYLLAHGMGTALSRASKTLDRIALRFLGGPAREKFSLNLVGVPLVAAVNGLRPDVVHLHWVGDGMVRPGQLKGFDAPIVWTLRDMWPFTGGCHYDFGCGRFSDACGRCPLLRGDRTWDASRFLLRRKASAWTDLDITLVALSDWIARQAERSVLFRELPTVVISPAVDHRLFRPLEMERAREVLDLPTDGFVIGFVALHPFTDRRKGLGDLLRAVEILRGASPSDDARPWILVVGGEHLPLSRLGHPQILHLPSVREDDRMRTVYAACDILAVPSKQEAFGKVSVEAMACGTPVVAYQGTGFEASVVHGRNGYLARPEDPNDLAKGLAWMMGDRDRLERMGAAALDTALTRFSFTRAAESHRRLYETILERTTR